MTEGEFDIIQRYFTASKRVPRKDVLLSCLLYTSPSPRDS